MNGVCLDVSNGEIACIEVQGKKLQSYYLSRLSPNGLRGFIEYLSQRYNFFYVRGRSKVDFIRKLQNYAVIYDLADVGCPPLGIIASTMDGKDCLEHGGGEECALTNVRLMQQWVLNYQSLSVQYAITSFKLTRCLKDMEINDLVYLPKSYYLECRQQIADVIDKLPPFLKNDPELSVYAREKRLV